MLTYQDVNSYAAYVLNNYDPEALVCFDGYSNFPMSTKVVEQCRRTTGQNVSPDILFERDMLVTSSQHACFWTFVRIKLGTSRL